MKTGEDKLKLALHLLNIVDDLLFPLENREVIGNIYEDNLESQVKIDYEKII